MVVKYADCEVCGRPAVDQKSWGELEYNKLLGYPSPIDMGAALYIRKRFKGRLHCNECLRPPQEYRPRSRRPDRSGDESSPGQDDALRSWEGS